MATSRLKRTMLENLWYSVFIFRYSHSLKATRRHLLVNECTIPKLCDPLQSGILGPLLLFKCQYHRKILCFPSAESLFLTNVSTGKARCSSDQLSENFHLHRCQRSSKLKQSECFCLILCIRFFQFLNKIQVNV